MLGEDWGVGEFLWSLIWFTLFFIWIWLLIMVFVDIFRSHDMGGFAKFLWVVFVLILPYLGVLVYIIARGGKMAEHAQAAAAAQDVAARQYIRSAATSSPADEIARLSDLKSQGIIDDDEFNRLKAQIVG
jgi:hypothetical protein